MSGRCKDGINVWNVLSVRNNSISDCTRYGLYVQDINNDVIISDNSFSNNGELDLMVNNVT